ncbi:hypothetical protein HXX76_009073 [Chlamydomonas incerta]|uniref:Peptidase M11 gametolysin domain-containing protein n=1 Tax=Chlamydomonas incerta TaxID=51695 RepID=A0A835T471_CHLIN|nr:hypothetical protein HXX76_009073 [Chlamydomonas incerta]|eukprot:KAG2432150.1 hypothetical protein HXX76_009073 [Chlamydomonas incerta]
MSALRVYIKDPKCNRRHLGKDYLYVSATSDNSTYGWLQVASGTNLQEELGINTGDVLMLTVRNTTSSSTSANSSSSGAGDSGGIVSSSPAAPPPPGSPPGSSGDGGGGGGGEGGARRRELLSATNLDLDAEDTEFLKLVNFTKVSSNTEKEIYNGTTINVKSITYIVSTCGWSAPISAEDLAAVWYNSSGTGALNLQDYHDVCTYGKVVWGPDNNLIVGPVQVACTGSVKITSSYSVSYNGATKCRSVEQYAWRTAGEAAARAAGYGDFLDNNKFLRLVTILPEEVVCGWAGLAEVGCSGKSCAAFIKGGSAADLPTHFHELGHMQGLMHAGYGEDEYGDGSDVMGNEGNGANGYLCLNPANAYRVGLATPVAVLTQSDTRGAYGKTYSLRPSSVTDRNYLMLNYSQGGLAYPNYFIGMRATIGRFDNILPVDLNNKVHVTQFNGSATSSDYNRSYAMAWLGAGESWTSSFLDTGGDLSRGGGVTVSVLALDADASPPLATVRVCFFAVQHEGGEEGSCANGVDDDSFATATFPPAALACATPTPALPSTPTAAAAAITRATPTAASAAVAAAAVAQPAATFPLAALTPAPVATTSSISFTALPTATLATAATLTYTARPAQPSTAATAARAAQPPASQPKPAQPGATPPSLARPTLAAPPSAALTTPQPNAAVAPAPKPIPPAAATSLTQPAAAGPTITPATQPRTIATTPASQAPVPAEPRAAQPRASS